ncbi:hypothetical protein RRG08_021159 [Elysia crispata]|uniref:Methyltransferase type 11 domain-containing protein n=1 Tax=Elysia crispata TaxID=231223 RepID=A0AAE0Z5Y9_9GAST|nr:hypothetical protein RRG08_021159 [Elysia crispata]
MSDEKVAAKSEFTLPSLFVDKNTSYHYANHRHSYSEELFRLISDFCKEKLENLNLAVDVGCGPGNSTVGFTKHFKQVIGVDISESQIALAPKDIPNCQFKVGSATDLEFLPAASVDLLSCGLAFNLMPKKEFLAEADRILKPGGTLAIFGYSSPRCSDQVMDDLLQWMHDKVIPYVGKELIEAWELYPDLELPYPGWIRRDDLMITQMMSPEGILGLGKLHRRFLIENGHEEINLLPEIEDRMAAALQEIRQYSDGLDFEMKFKTVVIMGHKPLQC